MQDRTCNWGNCEAPYTTAIKAPLCDAHVVNIYRQIAEVVKDPRMTDLINIMALPSEIPTAAPGRARTQIKKKPGTIYFIRFGQRVKIGYTTNLKQRMSRLKPDEILATVPGTMQDEEKLHFRFGHLWEEKETFRLEGELLTFIEKLKKAA